MIAKISQSSFFSVPSDVTSDFILVNRDGDKGRYYSETKRAIVYLFPHTQINDLISSINHEIYHHVIDGDELDLDEEQEECLIDKLTWALEGVLI